MRDATVSEELRCLGLTRPLQLIQAKAQYLADEIAEATGRPLIRQYRDAKQGHDDARSDDHWEPFSSEEVKEYREHCRWYVLEVAKHFKRWDAERINLVNLVVKHLGEKAVELRGVTISQLDPEHTPDETWARIEWELRAICVWAAAADEAVAYRKPAWYRQATADSITIENLKKWKKRKGIRHSNEGYAVEDVIKLNPEYGDWLRQALREDQAGT